MMSVTLCLNDTLPCTSHRESSMGLLEQHHLIKARTSRKLTNHIQPNALRPHVAAADRSLLWMTPFGIRDMDFRSKLLPMHIITQERLVVTRSISPRALVNYSAGLLRFTRFCDDLDIAEDLRMPAPEWLLSAFVTTCGAGDVGKGALSAWILGLQLWHNINNAPWSGGSHLKRALQGAARMAPPSSNRNKHIPITLQHLQALHLHLTLTNTFDAAVFAMACVSFWCQCRLSEVCIDCAFDPSRHATQESLQLGGTTTSGVTAVCIIQGMRLFILKKKKMSHELNISINFAQNDLNLFLSYSLRNRLVHHNKILLI